MVKTTVYLSEDLKTRLKRAAVSEGVSEAEVIRAALEKYMAPRERPRPTLPLFDSAPPIENWDEALRGFGER